MYSVFRSTFIASVICFPFAASAQPMCTRWSDPVVSGVTEYDITNADGTCAHVIAQTVTITCLQGAMGTSVSQLFLNTPIDCPEDIVLPDPDFATLESDTAFELLAR